MLSGRNAFALAFDGTLGKINGLATLAASVGLIKFIREYLFFRTAFGAFAGDDLEVFKISITGTMLGSRNVFCHDFLRDFKFTTSIEVAPNDLIQRACMRTDSPV